MSLIRAFYPKAAEYTFFLSAYETFARIDHIFEHKTSLNKCNKFEIISSIFSNQNGMKLEINYKKKKVKQKSMESNMLLNNEWLNNQIN